ncbi:uncharacterized protein LOC114526852 [Dendronephthya gigantea]|uniref:uncharacterized protein LOC114526852 n=1 Tax=Dendronephthya gigantea TaxID=151771 RepID=UPI00106C3017|nr:uncharacterized protein LOC114526852 [Dendronephthya gigantea]
MNVERSDCTPDEKGQLPEANSDQGLLETFNLALSNIIRNPKESPICSSEFVSRPKKQRPQTSDDDERISSESNFDSRAECKNEIIASDEQPIKQEDSQTHFDDYREWIDGNEKRRYCLTSREAQSHSSGWAMKYTNNHNKYVLKKTCVGVLMCSENCRFKDGTNIRIRPAISDKVRERQLGQQCPNSECKNGRIVHRKCSGNNGYPVTHFWVHHMDHIQFESKGTHDHPKPEPKRSSIKKRDDQSRKCSSDENLVPLEGYATYTHPFLPPYLRSEDLNSFARYVNYHSEYIRSCDVTDGNEHVSVATVPMRELAREIFSEENNDAKFSEAYVLCRTLPNYFPGFDLLESRLLSCATPECPLVLATLYRSGGVDGILEHIKHLTVMCSCPLQKIRVPKWHYLVHDFSRELKTLAVETIVNLMVDAQMQTLLSEFQYKSVSSLYKMLRQRMMGTLRSFEEHYRICRYELMLRIQDPRVLASAEDMLARLQSQYCSGKEFLNIDALIKDGIIGDQVREFWYFWGSDLISSAVFPAAKKIYDFTLCRHHHCSIAAVKSVANVEIF